MLFYRWTYELNSFSGFADCIIAVEMINSVNVLLSGDGPISSLSQHPPIYFSPNRAIPSAISFSTKWAFLSSSVSQCEEPTLKMDSKSRLYCLIWFKAQIPFGDSQILIGRIILKIFQEQSFFLGIASLANTIILKLGLCSPVDDGLPQSGFLNISFLSFRL